MYLFKAYISLVPIIVLLLTISCDNKREALGADNEIRVICSEVDREIIQQYLSGIFSDTRIIALSLRIPVGIPVF